MAGPVLVPNLAVLRAEINARWPKRDKRSDGWIGNRAHQSSPSGHNPDESGNAERRDADNKDEVRAIDLDKDIDLAPGDELYAELDRIRRTPELRRRLIYIIYRGRICSASNGWVWKTYTGDNPHTEHGHLSGHPDHDDNTAPWGIAGGDEDMGFFDQAQLDKRTGAQLIKDLWWSSFKGNALDVHQQALARLEREVAAARLRDEAILAAVKGVDGRQILARIDQVAAAEATRDEQAARERAALADLVRQGASGELAADEAFRRISELLTAATGQG